MPPAARPKRPADIAGTRTVTAAVRATERGNEALKNKRAVSLVKCGNTQLTQWSTDRRRRGECGCWYSAVGAALTLYRHCQIRQLHTRRVRWYNFSSVLASPHPSGCHPALYRLLHNLTPLSTPILHPHLRHATHSVISSCRDAFHGSAVPPLSWRGSQSRLGRSWLGRSWLGQSRLRPPWWSQPS